MALLHLSMNTTLTKVVEEISKLDPEEVLQLIQESLPMDNLDKSNPLEFILSDMINEWTWEANEAWEPV